MSKRKRPVRSMNNPLLNPSESSASEIVNHQQADIHTAANQKLKGIRVPEETGSFNRNCSLSKNLFTCYSTDQERINKELPSWSQFRPRSRPRTRKSKVTADTSHSEVIPQQASRCSQFKPRPHSRKRTKSKIADDTTDSEVIPLRASRCHGQSRRNNNQKGLGSSKFELYLESIWKGHPEDRRNAFTYLDSLWFSLYSERSQKAKVLNWITKKKIFSKKYVFVPIVLWNHWSLLIFCHLGESLQSKAKSPCMLLLDSLRMASPERFEPGIRKFVIDLFKAEQRPETKDQIRKIPLKIPKVPQQRNDEDCGNFVLYYINLFLKNAPENFSISKGYPYFLECFFQELQSTAAGTSNSDEILCKRGNSNNIQISHSGVWGVEYADLTQLEQQPSAGRDDHIRWVILM
ncbi:hypothetical protein K7X08_033870 [Anisodus acutangulus]|uniref:Ubiquitin-like protease family profile domain-containing protein n=1 Tax=Anisodus acutangulus TaxID=402998 RepID=A0A9Q1M5S9_9SOLA|nr:hypothetical protein K7X08_033870 [Anisodus acutangulus]